MSNEDQVSTTECGNAGPLISIATVCFNAISTAPSTAESLDRQTFRDFEWVVVDGASNDGTTEWLKTNRSKMGAFVSEPDKGIFDAMNKAAGMARGEWIYFLNADDRLGDNEVLADVARELIRAPSDVGVVYGDAMYSDGRREWLRQFSWVRAPNLVYGDLCHQVVFARRRLFREVSSFDTSLRFNADFDWLLKLVRAKVQFHHLDRTICVFFHGGAHVQNAKACEAERFRVRYRYRNPLQWQLGNFFLRVELKFRRLFGQSV